MEVEEEGEESKWQDKISSGFDRLVAFASTELDKRRRSTEGSDSCNTSPDSGISVGDPPVASVCSAPTKPAIKLNPNAKPCLLKSTSKKLGGDCDQSEDVGPPRTPSPSTVGFVPAPNQSERSLNPALLKYQRHTEEKKQKPDQHFKKKFYYREWQDDAWQKQFKPKGKDYDWNRDITECANDDWSKSGRDQHRGWKN